MNGKSDQAKWLEKHKAIWLAQRKFLWPEEKIKKIAEWINLDHGMTVLDVGCGAGFLGQTYRDYFKNDGTYVGVDISLEITRNGKAAAADWATNGEAYFIAGDGYTLPLKNNSVNLVMSQILFIHVHDPRRILEEMKRVLKPGGYILCKEQDHFGANQIGSYNSAMAELNLDRETKAAFARAQLISYEGKIRLGRGDGSIITRIPRLMCDLGLEDVAILQDSRVAWIHPPYTTPELQHGIEMLKQRFLNETNVEIFRKRDKEEFLAGGGTEKEYEFLHDFHRRYIEKLKEQIESEKFYSCHSRYFYIVKGRKK
jgi:ubiquinone/menaquinone biosynthesis C-methylase UbiE